MKEWGTGMKPFVVFTANLALAPLHGQIPPGARMVDFDSLEQAQAFVAEQKDQWDRVSLYKKHENYELERIEHYQHGQRYIDDQRTR